MLTEEPSMEEIVAILTQESREEGIEQGLERGREEGHEQASMQIAKNLLAKGSTPEFVQEITGLSHDKINEINI